MSTDYGHLLPQPRRCPARPPWPLPTGKRCGRKATSCAPRGGGRNEAGTPFTRIATEPLTAESFEGEEQSLAEGSLTGTALTSSAMVLSSMILPSLTLRTAALPDGRLPWSGCGALPVLACLPTVSLARLELAEGSNPAPFARKVRSGWAAARA